MSRLRSGLAQSMVKLSEPHCAAAVAESAVGSANECNTERVIMAAVTFPVSYLPNCHVLFAFLAQFRCVWL